MVQSNPATGFARAVRRRRGRPTDGLAAALGAQGWGQAGASAGWAPPGGGGGGRAAGQRMGGGWRLAGASGGASGGGPGENASYEELLALDDTIKVRLACHQLRRCTSGRPAAWQPSSFG